MPARYQHNSPRQLYGLPRVSVRLIRARGFCELQEDASEVLGRSFRWDDRKAVRVDLLKHLPH